MGILAITRYLAAYASCIGVMLVLDGLWIGVLARLGYQQGIGQLMAEQVNGLAAAAFYLVYGLGLMFFVVSPSGASTPWRKTLVSGALFGFVAYATYDLTNLATLQNWPLGVSLMDMAWGSVVSLCAAASGKWMFDRIKA